MLSLNYGNFLTVKEKKNEEYNYIKPVLKLLVNGILTFSVIGFLVSGIAYTMVKMEPQTTYNSSEFQKANKVSSNLINDLKFLHDARPQDINICQILQKFLIARPEDVSISNIVIKPERYIVKGCANAVDNASEFTQKLSFENRNTKLADIKDKDNVIYWTIEVTQKPKETKQGAKK